MGQLISNKGAKNIQWGNDGLVNKWCWENCISTWKRMKVDPHLTSLTKFNPKWIKDLNMGLETVRKKFLEKKTGEKLLNDGLGDDFFGYDNKSKINMCGT